MHWSEVWEADTPSARLNRTLLTPISWVYAAAWEIYLSTYRLGLKKSMEPHCPVVCVGNLVAGGTGKSPITLFVARLLIESGHQVTVGCSGYGSPRSAGAAVAPSGQLSPTEWGDEPAMMRWLLPEVPLVVGRDRVLAAELCHEAYPRSVLVMDDGFQHLPLKKHLTLVLDPARRNRRCLPAGPYREPWRNRRRATLVLPNGFKPDMRIESVSGATDGCMGEDLKPGTINVLCAIGDPTRFVGELKAIGFEVREAKSLADHDDLAAGNLMDGLDARLPLVTTAKDWVKLRNRPDIQRLRVFVARQAARIQPEVEFRAWLQRELDELTKKSAPG